MNKKNLFKFTLDLGMAVVLVLMYNTRAIDMTFHELGGLILIGVMLIHMLLNYKWVIRVTKRLFDRNLSVKTKLGYILNFLLLISFLLIGISGILISKTLFHLNIRNGIWQTVHYTTAAIALILIGIHIGLHKEFLCCMLKKLIPLPKKLGRATGILISCVFIVYGCYSMITTGFSRWLTLPFTASIAPGGFDGGDRQGIRGRLPQDGTLPGNYTGPQEGGFQGDNTFPSDDQNSQNNTIISNDITKSSGIGADGQTTQQTGRGQRTDSDFHGNDRNGFPVGKGESGGSMIVLSTIMHFFSIAYLFAALTVLIEWFLKRNNLRENS